jgi:hypothetical protein
VAWLDSANTLLAAANGAALSSPVARSFVAPGSIFARDCRLLAVHPSFVDAVPFPPGDLPGQGCSVVPALVLTLTFLADCYPTANDAGNPPPPADVTAWTLDFLADIESIWNEVADAALGGTLGDDPAGVHVGAARWHGRVQSAGAATVSVSPA